MYVRSYTPFSRGISFWQFNLPCRSIIISMASHKQKFQSSISPTSPHTTIQATMQTFTHNLITSVLLTPSPPHIILIDYYHTLPVKTFSVVYRSNGIPGKGILYRCLDQTPGRCYSRRYTNSYEVFWSEQTTRHNSNRRYQHRFRCIPTDHAGSRL